MRSSGTLTRTTSAFALALATLGSSWLVACSDGAEFTAAPASESGDAAAPTATPRPASGSGLTADRARIDFGAAACGAPVAPQSLTLHNGGARDVAYSVFLDDESAFTLGGASKGGLGPDASAAITVTPKAIASNAAAGQPIAATLTITSDDPAHAVQTIALQVTPTGGTLEVSPSTIDFGQVPLGAPPASSPITLRNTGNAPVTLTIAKPGDASSPFALSAASTVTLAPGATVGSAAATFHPTKEGAATADATVSVSGATCGASAAKIAMRGRGTAGSAEISPGELDFDVSCAAAAIAAAQSIVVTNRGSAALAVSNVSVTGAFKLATESTDRRLSPNGVTTIAVVALPAAPGDLGGAGKDGSLSFDTNDPAEAHVSLPLHANIVGANVAFASASGAPASTLDFGVVASGMTGTQSIRVVNTGNTLATVAPSPLTAPFGWSSGASRGVAPGASVAFGVTFAPTAAGTFSAVANVDTMGAVCVGPGALPVAGTANAPSATPPSAVSDSGAGAVAPPDAGGGAPAAADAGTAADGASSGGAVGPGSVDAGAGDAGAATPVGSPGPGLDAGGGE